MSLKHDVLILPGSFSISILPHSISSIVSPTTTWRLPVSMYQRYKFRMDPVVFGQNSVYRFSAQQRQPTNLTFARQQHTGRESESPKAATPSPTLTHLDASGRASMVSISSKVVTTRRATATGRIYLPPVAYNLLAHSPSGSNFKKGDVLGTARIAGIMAGKRTSELIPLCHPIGLTDLKVKFRLEAGGSEGTEKEGGWVGVQAVAECEGKTGVEVSSLLPAQVENTVTDSRSSLRKDGSLDIGVDSASYRLGHGQGRCRQGNGHRGPHGRAQRRRKKWRLEAHSVRGSIRRIRHRVQPVELSGSKWRSKFISYAV